MGGQAYEKEFNRDRFYLRPQRFHERIGTGHHRRIQFHGAIHHIGNVHKYARPEDVPEHTMFVITTDGIENASHRYNSEKVKQMIERQKAKYGWEFLFLGANIDAVETASQFGIGADRAVNYQCDSEGTALNYEVVSEAISSVRCSAPLSADWKKRIDEDYKKRGGCKHK